MMSWRWPASFSNRRSTRRPNWLIPRKTSVEEAQQIAQESAGILKGLDELSHDSTDAPLRALAERLGLKAGQVFGVLRGAVTGQQVSPPLLETMEILGKDIVVARVQKAAQILAARAD